MNDSGHGGIVEGLPASQWIDAADLLSEPDPGPTPWLVEDLIVDGALVACAGRWKTTKSYAMLHIAVSIATGRPAFGALAIPNPGPVVFCNEESGRTALWRRLDSLTRAYDVAPEDLRGLLVLAANARIKLDDRGWQDELQAIGRELRPRLFVFDPLARMKAAGREENEQTAMAPIIEFARHLRDESGAAVSLVHHTGHSGDHLRGTSDLESAWETRLTWKREGQASTVTLSSDHREAEPAAPITYRIEWDGDARTMRFEAVDPPATAELAAALAWILDHVKCNPGQSRSAVEGAFAEEHRRGGRALARRIIDGELTASTPQLAKGKGPAANGIYLYPATEASSPLADSPTREHGEQVSGQGLPLQLASSPPPFRGGRAASSEQPDIDPDEIERLAALALEAQGARA
jgi:hypothetical protein